MLHGRWQRRQLRYKRVVVQIQQNNIRPELRLVLARHTLLPQIVIHVLQSLQALCQILTVDLGIEHRSLLGAQSLRRQYVKPGALLDQLDRLYAAQSLLSDVLAYAPHSVPEEVIPLGEIGIVVLAQIGYLVQEIGHGHS